MRRLGLTLAFVLVFGVALPGRAAAIAVAQQWPTFGTQPFGVTVDPGTGLLYVSNSGGTGAGTMIVVDPTQPPSPYPTLVSFASAPTMSVLDGALGRLFVTTADGTLAIVDVATRTTVATVARGGALGVALDASTHHVYASWASGLSVIDGATGAVLASATAPSGDSWWGVALDPARHRVYAAEFSFSAPSVVALDDRDLSLVGRTVLPEIPRLALAVDSGRGLVYVGGYSTPTYLPAGHLYAIDETTLAIVKTVDVGFNTTSPFWATFDAAHDRLYVSGIDQYAGELVTVDAGSFAVTGRAPLPWQPGQSALHPDGRLYVAGFGAGVVAALTFDNSAPIVDAVSVTPAAPKTNDLVTAHVTAHDPENDPITLSYRWYRNGVLLTGEASASLDLSKPGNGDRGDQVAVVVNASDGSLVSADTLTSTWSFFVADTAPSVTVSLDRTTAGTNDVLHASAVGSDVDRDALAYTFTWKVNGAVRRTVSGAAAGDAFDLSLAGNGDRGDVVTVDVVAFDGQLASAPASASATIVNSAPTVTVALDPSTPGKRDTLTASASAADADGDTLAYAFTWTLNGAVVATSTTTAGTSTFDVRTVETEYGDVLTVTVVVTDGRAQATATASAAVTRPSH